MKNYFNYFTEIEEHFIRRRGKNLLVSPLDWCLIEVWRGNGIPLHIVLRGIDQSFEAAQRSQRQPPRTLSYCHAAVVEAFEEFRSAMVGAPEDAEVPDSESAPGRKAVVEFLERLRDGLANRQGEVFVRAAKAVASLAGEVARAQAADLRSADRDLTGIGRVLAEGLREGMDGSALDALLRAARAELKVYRQRLSADMYAQLERNYLDRTVHRLHDLPEFSLLTID